MANRYKEPLVVNDCYLSPTFYPVPNRRYRALAERRSGSTSGLAATVAREACGKNAAWLGANQHASECMAMYRFERDTDCHESKEKSAFMSDIDISPDTATSHDQEPVLYDVSRLLRPRRNGSYSGVQFFDPPLNGVAAFVKRAEDILLALILLAATAPLMLLVSVVIKLGSRGPVLFRQPRHGLNGLEIQVFKFRTMYAHLEDTVASRQTSRDDSRVTWVGRFLRRHSIDELPQLFNVLLGTMSLVGPRPHARGTTAGGLSLELAVPGYMARHRVKPGITGWAQVSGCRGNLDSVEKAVRRVECDLYYIENWSLLLDLQIIAKTIRLIIHDIEAF